MIVFSWHLGRPKIKGSKGVEWKNELEDKSDVYSSDGNEIGAAKPKRRSQGTLNESIGQKPQKKRVTLTRKRKWLKMFDKSQQQNLGRGMEFKGRIWGNDER